MSIFEVLFIAVGLSLDAFAVALSIGASGVAPTRRDAVRLSFHFGLFQFMMPVIGWMLGVRVAPLIAQFDHWIAFGLLAFVGGHMVHASFHPEHAEHMDNPTRGHMLVILSVATSIDALAIGLSLAMLRIEVLHPSMIIGLVTFSFSMCGMLFGVRLNERFGARMMLIGGTVLISIGLRVLVQHLSGAA
ncbi:MAG: manganese efflux pump MntP family protein [Acidobacteriota bacterium]